MAFWDLVGVSLDTPNVILRLLEFSEISLRNVVLGYYETNVSFGEEELSLYCHYFS